MVVSTRRVALLPDSDDIQSAWPWHAPLVGCVRASMLKVAQRRMEAETYLTSGYGIRQSIEAKLSGWVRFSEIAHASAPPRIKQILVSPENGVPYLNTSQVFDIRPKPRKWLAVAKTAKAAERLVKEGAILVMASATVGRAIVAAAAHEHTIISHHFMRVTPVKQELSGWVYAYLRSPQAQAMMRSAQYASVIRHIEPHHLVTLPVPEVSKEVAADFRKTVTQIVACRNNAAKMTGTAESIFAEAIGPMEIKYTENGFTVPIRCAMTGRRRLEATYHAPQVQAILRGFKKWELLGKITKRIWWPNRFKRLYGDTGTPYMSADDVFTTNPYGIKSVMLEGKKDCGEFAVESGWIVMARSGQVYGLNGSAMLVNDYHKGFFLSEDLIRIIPNFSLVRSGYLLTALTHPALGRPLITREAYGMSIPHLDPQDVATFPVVRLDRKTEDIIADLAENAASERARAEVLERELGDAAGQVISEFLVRPSLRLVPPETI